jgi:hypothetical protein
MFRLSTGHNYRCSVNQYFQCSHSSVLQDCSSIPDAHYNDLGVTVDGVWIDEWIYWSLIKRLGTKSNYSATANLQPAVPSPVVAW